MLEYGVVIILITILTRVFVVSISWNYGLFLVALKQTYPDAQFSELGKHFSIGYYIWVNYLINLK
jgi:hypothetical protein